MSKLNILPSMLTATVKAPIERLAPDFALSKIKRISPERARQLLAKMADRQDVQIFELVLVSCPALIPLADWPTDIGCSAEQIRYLCDAGFVKAYMPTPATTLVDVKSYWRFIEEMPPGFWSEHSNRRKYGDARKGIRASKRTPQTNSSAQ